MDTKDLFTVQDAAKEIGVTEGAIRNAMNLGRLPFVMNLGRKTIERHVLEEYKARTQPNGVKVNGRPSGSKAIKKEGAE